MWSGRRRRGWERRLLLMLAASANFLILFQVFSLPSSARVETGDEGLLVVGAGNLGQRVAGRWLAHNAGVRVVGATLTEESHASLRSLGVEPMTVSDLEDTEAKFPFVVFCAPPRTRSNPDSSFYVQAVMDALSHWQSTKDRGSFVFTSSGGVIAEDSGALVNEESQVSDSPGSLPLLTAEEIVLGAGGTVLRLAGLYDVKRGGHAYWMNAGVVKGNPEGMINLLHYDDAATAVERALTSGSAKGKLFLVSDGAAMSRRAIVEAAHASRAFSGMKMPEFEAGSDSAAATGAASAGRGGMGKVYDTSRMTNLLGWEPMWKSFDKFMASQC